MSLNELGELFRFHWIVDAIFDFLFQDFELSGNYLDKWQNEHVRSEKENSNVQNNPISPNFNEKESKGRVRIERQPE